MHQFDVIIKEQQIIRTCNFLNSGENDYVHRVQIRY